jgi:hypothetical protein
MTNPNRTGHKMMQLFCATGRNTWDLTVGRICFKVEETILHHNMFKHADFGSTVHGTAFEFSVPDQIQINFTNAEV